MTGRSAYTYKIPDAFLDRMATLLGEEYPAFLSSLESSAVIGLRVNPLKISVSDFIERSPWNLSPVSWCSAGFVIGLEEMHQSPPGKHPFHAAGLYYLQEPSAMAAAEILAPKPGETVLDLAAAPGGKSTHIAALMANSGVLIANEIHPKRVWDLVENLDRCGVTNAIVTNETPQNLADHLGEYFDKVLLDAPCSGEGMFRKGEVARQEWKPELVHSCATRQASILEQAARMVKPGGHLVYTTCTFSPDENEGVIAKFLERHEEFDLETSQQFAGFGPGRPEWVGLPLDNRLKHAIRIWPHKAHGEGHFLTMLIKKDSLMKPEIHTRQKARKSVDKYTLSKLDKSTQTIFDNFCGDNLKISFDGSNLAQAGTSIFLRPHPAPDLSGLHVLHYGRLLGYIQKRRFIPAHQLAMGIKRNQACHSLMISPDDQRLLAYFRGESLPDSGKDAWVLICVDDYPVGWAKRVQNVLKNFYPRGLRRRLD